MLIQGGITSRDRLINGTIIQLFDWCEYYDDRFDINPERRPEHFKTCAEEILQDIWRYYPSRPPPKDGDNKAMASWSFVKIDFNANIYASIKAPHARYGHAGAYIQLVTSDEVYDDNKLNFERKFVYLYGGFSYSCETACYDTWRYEIPYVPVATPPVSRWTNSGNHWELL